MSLQLLKATQSPDQIVGEQSEDEDEGLQGIEVSALQLAAGRVEPLDVPMARHAGAVFRCVRNGVEYLRDAGALPRLQPSMGLDVMPALRRVVAAQRLVRDEPAGRDGCDRTY